MKGLLHIALRTALALGALLSGAPGVVAGQVTPTGVAKTGTDGVGGIEKHEAPTPTHTVTSGGSQPPISEDSPWKDLGLGKPGGQGQPTLTGFGTGQPGTVVALQLNNGRPLAIGTLIIGFSSSPVPFKSGTLVPTPQMLITGLPVGLDGSLLLPAMLPAAMPSGIQICAQLWLSDPTAIAGVSATNGLLLQVP